MADRDQLLEELLEIGIALTGERDLYSLLERILDAARRVTRAHNKQLTGFPVGQIVGSMNSVRPVRDVIFDMVEEWVETTQRLDTLIETE